MGNTRASKNALKQPACEVCGYSIFITLHRIHAGRNGGKYTETNTITLCSNCHQEAECGILSEERLVEIFTARLQLQQKLKELGE